MIRAVIFDMDGLIIDSEPLWRKAEVKVFNSIGLNFTEDLCRQTMGMRIDEVVSYWHQHFSWTESNVLLENRIVDELISLINKEGKALPGIIDTIIALHQNEIPLAIASSSNMKIIDTVIDKLNIRNYFTHIHSAEYEKYGKPHPQVFLTVAEKFNVAPENCLVFEDSKHGMIAALAAKMQVIVIPENPHLEEAWHHLANRKLHSMKEFKLHEIILA